MMSGHALIFVWGLRTWECDRIVFFLLSFQILHKTIKLTISSLAGKTSTHFMSLLSVEAWTSLGQISSAPIRSAPSLFLPRHFWVLSATFSSNRGRKKDAERRRMATVAPVMFTSARDSKQGEQYESMMKENDLWGFAQSTSRHASKLK